jgi:hypothetical protein
VIKRKQKNFPILVALAQSAPDAQIGKSFLPPGGLLLFFKKAALASLPSKRGLWM